MLLCELNVCGAVSALIDMRYHQPILIIATVEADVVLRMVKFNNFNKVTYLTTGFLIRHLLQLNISFMLENKY